MIAFLRRFFCRHTTLLRSRAQDGSLTLRCACGYEAPALTRSPAEWAQVKSGDNAGQLSTKVKVKKTRARKNNVTPMRRVQ